MARVVGRWSQDHLLLTYFLEDNKMSAQTTNTQVAQKKQDKYEKHGFPKPNNKVDLTVEMMKKARDMANDNSGTMIKYLRDYKVAAIKNEQGHITGNKVIKGQPYAAMVAFKEGDKIIIGWSKRHSGKLVNIEGYLVPEREFDPALFVTLTRSITDVMKQAKYMDIEPLPFSKKDAVAVAILRGMTDTITIKAGTVTLRTKDGRCIPKCIERVLPHFIQRAESYFKVPAVNVIK